LTKQLSLSEALEICTQRCKQLDAPLEDRLASFADDVRRLAPQFQDTVDRMVVRLQSAKAGEAAPAVGEVMPPFVLPDENGRLVGLQRLLKSSQVVVAFHRGHWCPYCRINADTLARIDETVKSKGGQLIVITPETQKFARMLKQETGATFPVLADLDSGYALDMRLAIKINDEKRSAMVAAGYDVSPYNGNDDWILPIPATFVIGQDGIIKARFVDPDYRKRMGIRELLAGLN
jgi:peroxiredoxin